MANIPFLNNAYFSAKVGIGTDNPQTKLHVVGPDANASAVTLRVGGPSDGQGNNVSRLELVESTTNSNADMLYGFSFTADGNNSNNLLIKNHNNSVAGNLAVSVTRIDGNVGIGTTSTSQKLEVSTSNYNVSKFVGNTDNGSGYVGAVVEIESNNDARGRGVYLTHRLSTDTTDSEWYAGVPYTGDGYSIGNAAYGTSINSDTGPAHKDQSKLFITEGGNVGIGTTSPDARLDVKETTSDVAGEIIVGGLIASDNVPFGKISFANTATANTQTNDVLASIAGEKVGSSNRGELTFLTSDSAAPAERMRISSAGAIKFNDYDSTNNTGTPTYLLGTDASGNIVKTNTVPGSGAGPYLPLAGGTMAGTITMNNNRITSIEELRFNNGGNIGNQINTDVDTGTETVANVEIATYTAAFFDFVIKKTTNVRSGTVYACHDGTSVVFTETSTNDLGDTSDVTLSVDISGTNMRLLATVTSDDWSVKSLIRAI